MTIIIKFQYNARSYCLKVAPYTILQRFEYYICINNFFIGKFLSRNDGQKVNKNLQRQTTHVRLFQNLNVVAMVTTDIDVVFF